MMATECADEWVRFSRLLTNPASDGWCVTHDLHRAGFITLWRLCDCAQVTGVAGYVIGRKGQTIQRLAGTVCRQGGAQENGQSCCHPRSPFPWLCAAETGTHMRVDDGEAGERIRIAAADEDALAVAVAAVQAVVAEAREHPRSDMPFCVQVGGAVRLVADAPSLRQPRSPTCLTPGARSALSSWARHWTGW